jgi:DnaK suppressor protein
MRRELCGHKVVVVYKSNMNKPLDKSFLDRQRGRLLELRKQLIANQSAEAEEADETNLESASGARTFEDDAQRLDALELDGQLSAASRQRVQTIDRALQKIEDGTYGLSDQSHEPIPTARLEAIPEAILTLEEQASRD